MNPPSHDPSRRPASKGPAGPGGTPHPSSGSASRPPGKGSGGTSRVSSGSKSGTPPPPPAPSAGTPPSSGKTSKLRRPSSSAPLRRTGPIPHVGGGKKIDVKVLAIGGGAGILAIIGIIFAIKSGQVDPEKVKAELKAKLEEIDRMPPEQIIEQHEAYEKLLQNPAYTMKYCGAVWKQLEKAEEDSRPKAELLKKANAEVKPFLDRYPGTVSLDPVKANTLLEQVKALQSSYAATVYGERLDAIRKELADWLDKHATVEESPAAALMTLKRDALDAANGGDFKKATDLVKAYAQRFKVDQAPDLKKRLEEEVGGRLARMLQAFVKGTLDNAKNLHEEGKDKGPGEAHEVLKKAMQGLEGLPEKRQLEEYLKSIGG